MSLWIRCGDQDDYHNFGEDFDAAADYLQEMGAVAPLQDCWHYNGRLGVTDQDSYRENNYISLYWGEEVQPEAIRHISEQELADINTALVKAWKEYDYDCGGGKADDLEEDASYHDH